MQSFFTAKRQYSGDILMQKYFRADHLSKQDIKNSGQIDRYFMQDHHTPIVDRETFQHVQDRMDLQRETHAGTGGRRGAFSGMLHCTKCGKSYKRKTTHGKAAWQCSTFITLGKRFCHTKQIPEDILIATTVSVLGITEFDEEVFLNQIERIEVPAFNHLVYIFKDGHREERIWQDKSRRDSWTDEMRQQARRRNQK